MPLSFENLVTPTAAPANNSGLSFASQIQPVQQQPQAPQQPMSSGDSIWSGLVTPQSSAPQGSQNNPDTFQSPLQNIAKGNSQTNLEVGKGAIKQGLADFSSAGAQNAGPIGKAMLANAPAFAQDIQGLNQKTQPTNPAQVIGAGNTKAAELAIPADIGANAAVAAKTASNASKIVDMVSPKLTAAESADALAARGGTKTGILGTIKANIDPSVKRIADAVKANVPDFSPSKSLVQNINATKSAVSSLATDLKSKVVASGKDVIYPIKELKSALTNVERPTLIAADSTLNKAYDLVISKAVEIARDNGGKVSSLLDARQELDSFIGKQFPNLYSSDTLTPMRQAIKGIRNAMTDFTAEHLPDDVNLHDALTTQSRLLTAIENMSEKAASGVSKEIGTNVIERATTAIKNHPVVAGAGAAALYGAAKKIPIVGSVLP